MAKKKEENEAILEPGKHKTLKSLSKVLNVFATIARVFIIIGLVAIVLTAVITPFIMKDVTINREEISFKSKKIELRENESDTIDIYYRNKKVGDLSKVDKKIVLDLLDHFDAKRITAIIETALMASIIIMILTFIMLGYFAKVLKNIYEKDTPFIEENTDLIRKIGFFMIATFIASMICSGIISFVTSNRFNLSFDFVDIGGILIVFILSYVFEYGCGLQAKIEKQ